MVDVYKDVVVDTYCRNGRKSGEKNLKIIFIPSKSVVLLRLIVTTVTDVGSTAARI